MRFDLSQHMRMSQQMKLAPRMIQSMEVLQMPMLALQERVDQELESNIALEIVEPNEESDEQADLQDKPLPGLAVRTFPGPIVLPPTAT